MYDEQQTWVKQNAAPLIMFIGLLGSGFWFANGVLVQVASIDLQVKAIRGSIDVQNQALRDTFNAQASYLKESATKLEGQVDHDRVTIQAWQTNINLSLSQIQTDLAVINARLVPITGGKPELMRSSPPFRGSN